MAEGPLRKRPVAGSRAVVGKSQKQQVAPMQQLPPLLEDDAPSENYALRLTEALEAIQSVEDGRPVRRSGAETARVPRATTARHW